MKSSSFAASLKKDTENRKKSDNVDLHMHSTFSDGGMSVQCLLELCAEQGLHAVAITDHDNIESYHEGQEIAKSLGMELIPGVEISSTHNGQDIHILGYMYEPTHLRLNRTLVELQDRRRGRAKAIVDRLAAAGLPLNFERILARCLTGSIGRAHIAAEMVEEEYVDSFQGAFTRYLGNDCAIMKGMATEKLTPQDAIELIEEAGGVAVLAHPSKTQCDDLIESLVNWGLKGIETYCLGQTYACFQKYRDIARQYELICCGGADFHVLRGDRKNAPGSLNIPYSVVERLRDAKPMGLAQI